MSVKNLMVSLSEFNTKLVPPTLASFLVARSSFLSEDEARTAIDSLTGTVPQATRWDDRLKMGQHAPRFCTWMTALPSLEGVALDDFRVAVSCGAPTYLPEVFDRWIELLALPSLQSGTQMVSVSGTRKVSPSGVPGQDVSITIGVARNGKSYDLLLSVGNLQPDTSDYVLEKVIDACELDGVISVSDREQYPFVEVDTRCKSVPRIQYIVRGGPSLSFTLWDAGGIEWINTRLRAALSSAFSSYSQSLFTTRLQRSDYTLVRRELNAETTAWSVDAPTLPDRPTYDSKHSPFKPPTSLEDDVLTRRPVLTWISDNGAPSFQLDVLHTYDGLRLELQTVQRQSYLEWVIDESGVPFEIWSGPVCLRDVLSASV